MSEIGSQMARPHPFGIRLSPRARERFGELLAKQLWIAAGGVGGFIVAPALVGTAAFPPPMLGAAFALMIIMAASGTLIHYTSLERLDEAGASKVEAND